MDLNLPAFRVLKHGDDIYLKRDDLIEYFEQLARSDKMPVLAQIGFSTTATILKEMKQQNAVET